MKRGPFALETLGLCLALVAFGTDAHAGGAPCGGGGSVGSDGGDAGEDAGTCPANEYCGLPDGGTVDDGGKGTCTPEACGGSFGACAVNIYCALPDGGAILDGAVGICQLEPCVASSDCSDPNKAICDTSQNPFACVECISGADCAGSLVCDTEAHACVNAPDASIPDGGALDGGADASRADAEASPDGALDAAGDASGQRDAAGPVVVVVPPEDGSLAGGAWDCGLAPGSRLSLAAIAGPLGLLALFVSRRRSKRDR